MAKLELCSERRKPVTSMRPDERWELHIGHAKLPDIEELRVWFLENVAGVKGELFYMLACLCDYEELYALRYAADMNVRYIEGENYDVLNTKLAFLELENKRLHERLEGYRSGNQRNPM